MNYDTLHLKNINPSNISTIYYFEDARVFNMFILLYTYIPNNIR